MPALSPNALVSRREHPLTNDLSDTETVMLDIERGTYFGLQHVGKVIWEQLESPIRVADLCGYLLTRFEVDTDTCQEEVDYFLAQLLDQGLIEVHDAPSAP